MDQVEPNLTKLLSYRGSHTDLAAAAAAAASSVTIPDRNIMSPLLVGTPLSGPPGISTDGEAYILTCDQISAFNSRGYITLPDIVTPSELDALEKEYLNLVNDGEVQVEETVTTVSELFKEDYGDHSSLPGTTKSEWKMVNVRIG